MADSGAPADSPPSLVEADPNERASRVKRELHPAVDDEEFDPDLLITFSRLHQRPERIARWEQTLRTHQNSNSAIPNMVSDAIATGFSTPPLVRLSTEERHSLYTTPTKQTTAGPERSKATSDGDKSRETNVTVFEEEDMDDDDEVGEVPSAPQTPGNLRDLEVFDIESDDEITWIDFHPAPTHTRITQNVGNTVKPEEPNENVEANRTNQTQEINEREPSVPLTPGIERMNFESDTEPDGLMIDEQDEPTFEPCGNNAQSQQHCGVSQTTEGEIMENEIIQLSPSPEPPNNETEQQIVGGESEILDDEVVLVQDSQPMSVPNPDQLAIVEADSTANAPRRRRRLNSTAQERVIHNLNMGRSRSPSPVCTCLGRITRRGPNSYHRAKSCPCRNRRKKKAMKQEDDSEPQEVIELSSDDSDDPKDIEDLEMSPDLDDPDVPCCSSSLRAKPLKDLSKKPRTLSPIVVTNNGTNQAESNSLPSTSRRAKRKRVRCVTQQRFKKRRNLFSRTSEVRKYQVEEIVGRRIFYGHEYLLVHWAGAKWSDPKHDEYICRSSLVRDAAELVQEYEQAHPRPTHTDEDDARIWSSFSEEDRQKIIANGIRLDLVPFVQPLPEVVTMEVPRRLEGVPKVQKEKKKRVYRSKVLPISGRSISKKIDLPIRRAPEYDLTERANEIYEAVLKLLEKPSRGTDRYCYFLLDETLIQEYLSAERIESLLLETFKKAIFYIGKGEYKRMLQHLEDADRFLMTSEHRRETKVKRVLDIWNNNGKVRPFAFFYNTNSKVAYMYECAMIENIGRKNLTNIQSGHAIKFDELEMNVNATEIAAFGNILVREALEFFRLTYRRFKGWTREMVRECEKRREKREKEMRLRESQRNCQSDVGSANDTESSTEQNLSTEIVEME
ncbi:ankyrin repeat and LEM domain-containing protein 1 [Ditylenchus destructor]|uniref:Ankyrin repeat and LEM domain-containing protein 1 n=1 Tax=Ditylenchus destructor TaxID=166010 RepID=A0AAD4N4X1_9BILA|nr:ankyrin repeat and LEM domain-containing protein 1 [Ditylenchus destructor]